MSSMKRSYQRSSFSTWCVLHSVHFLEIGWIGFESSGTFAPADLQDMCCWSPEMYTLDDLPTKDDCVIGKFPHLKNGGKR